MGDDAGIVNAIQTGGAAWAVLVAPWIIVASGITAILRGWLIPRKSHEEIVNTYRERAVETRIERDFWRDKSLAEERINERSIELTADLISRRQQSAGHAADLSADLATRRALSRPPRGEGQGAGNE